MQYSNNNNEMMTSSSSSSSSSSISIGAIGIPVEIVSEEEMAFIEAALSSTRSLLSSSSSSRISPFSPTPSLLARHTSSHQLPPSLAAPSAAVRVWDVEDCAPRMSLIERFRSKKGLAVTDITSTEWCDKQMEFKVLCGKQKKTAAMVAGSNRHTELEKEVVEKIEIHVNSREESWALKFLNFIVGANQLLFEGLTREIPVVGVIQGRWMVGVIDEVRMPIGKAIMPILVDTKTRCTATVPSEAQKRNGRLQLMCYKYLWDYLVAGTLPPDHFFNHFELNPLYILSENIKQYTASLGFHAERFEDVVKYYMESCFLLPRSDDQLLLRYELQSDRSLLEECQFAHDAVWLENQVEECLKFWSGEREAAYVTEDEKWKCNFCSFSGKCPVYAKAIDR